MTATFTTTGWVRRPQGVATAAETAPVENFTSTVPTGLIVTEGYRTMRVIVIGDTSNDDIDLEVWSVERISSRAGGRIGEVYFSRQFLDIDAILVGDGATVGAPDGKFLESDEKAADTYPAATISTYGQKVLANYNGSADVFSPTAQGIGELFISDLGNAYGVVLVFDTMVQNYADAMYKLDV